MGQGSEQGEATAGSAWERGASQCLGCRAGSCTPTPGSPPRAAQQWHSDVPLTPVVLGTFGSESSGMGRFGHSPEPKAALQSGLWDPGRVLCSRAQEPLCHHVWVLGESGQVRKHQPKGLSGAGLRNPPTHSTGSTSATSTLPRPRRCLPGVTAPSRPRFSPLCRRLRGPAHPLGIPACQPPVEPQIHPQLGPSTLQGEPLPMGLQQMGPCLAAFTYMYFSHL